MIQNKENENLKTDYKMTVSCISQLFKMALKPDFAVLKGVLSIT
jgi:hypothetical protein